AFRTQGHLDRIRENVHAVNDLRTGGVMKHHLFGGHWYLLGSRRQHLPCAPPELSHAQTQRGREDLRPRSRAPIVFLPLAGEPPLDLNHAGALFSPFTRSFHTHAPLLALSISSSWRACSASSSALAAITISSSLPEASRVAGGACRGRSVSIV